MVINALSSTRAKNLYVTISFYLILVVSIAGCSNIVQIVPFSDSPVPTPTHDPNVKRPVPLFIGSTQPPTNLNAPHQIVAPTINLNAPVLAMGWSETATMWGDTVSEWEIPYNEAGWHINSAVPNDGSNIIISGHNNSLGGRVFAQVENLKMGDEITLLTGHNKRFIYRVEQRNVVRAFMASAETDAYLQSILLPTASEQLTVITCWPSWSNTHRLVLVAKPK
ncbi:sortase [Anaerolineales bacterium HSG6]|nr:sortase [Anaerolineales bacterium HSG6]MDM8531666.1 sortase [Anaerolineales bacterium HSG25]